MFERWLVAAVEVVAVGVCWMGTVAVTMSGGWHNLSHPADSPCGLAALGCLSTFLAQLVPLPGLTPVRMAICWANPAARHILPNWIFSAITLTCLSHPAVAAILDDHILTLPDSPPPTHPAQVLRAHILPLTNCAFNKPGDRFITGSYDRTCKVGRVPNSLAPKPSEPALCLWACERHVSSVT